MLTVSDLLTAEGYEVETAGDGEAGLAKATAGKFDLVILDVMLPAQERLRRLPRTAAEGRGHRHPDAHRQDPGGGSRGGAEARRRRLPHQAVRSRRNCWRAWRRCCAASKRRSASRCSSFQFGDVEVDFERAEVRKGGAAVNLAGKELQLLRYLVDHRGRVVPREELLQNVWEYSRRVSSRTIDVHVAWLRQKLEDNPQIPSTFTPFAAWVTALCPNRTACHSLLSRRKASVKNVKHPHPRRSRMRP